MLSLTAACCVIFADTPGRPALFCIQMEEGWIQGHRGCGGQRFGGKEEEETVVRM